MNEKEPNILPFRRPEDEAKPEFYESAKSARPFVSPHEKDVHMDKVDEIAHTAPDIKDKPQAKAETETGLDPKHEELLKNDPDAFLLSIINNPNAMTADKQMDILLKSHELKSESEKPEDKKNLAEAA